MADEHLTEGSDWVDQIFQVALDTKWKGGADGTANMQAQALAARSQYLKKLAAPAKAQIDNLIESSGMTLDDQDASLLRKAITKMIQSGQRSVVINNAVFAPAVTGTGNAVYWDSVNSRFDLALADGSVKQNCVGFADVANGNVYAFGDAVLFAGLTPGARYYLDPATAGAITATRPTTNSVYIGVAKTATEVFVDIDSLQANGLLINVQVFTASGTYTPTPGTKSVIVEAVGGGGGGGGTYTTPAGQLAIGGGGGPGGYGKGRFTAGFSGVTVTVGAAGTAGAANSASAGGNGGTTSFGALMSCTGGSGGSPCSPFVSPIVIPCGASGTATGANICANGGSPGSPGFAASNGWESGAGGNTPFGRGGTQSGITSPGVAATGYGSGGSGGSTQISAAGQVGGAGAPGLVIVWEYA